MALAWSLLKKIYSLFCTLCSPLKRLWCRRKRHNSDPILPVTMNTHYPSVENLSNGAAQEELSPWDAWEDQSSKVRTVEQYRYYQQQALQRQTSDKEEEPDYFHDLTPSLTKQKKVLVRKKEEEVNPTAISSKLAVSSDIPLSQSADLGTWEEEKNAWDNEGTEDLSWEADNVIREKRRAERQQRQQEHQKKKLERDQQRQQARGLASPPHLATMKLS